MIDISETMISGEYVDETVYLEGVFVDEDTLELVIMLDPVQAQDPISVEDLQEELNVSVPIRIVYGYLVYEAMSSEATSCPADTGSSICYYWERYVERCLPERTTSRCTTYTTVITNAGYSMPTMLDVPADSDGDGINDDIDQCDDQAETVNGYNDSDGCPDTVPASTRTVIFSDDFEGGFSKWTRSGQLEWQIGYLDDRVYIDGDSTNRVAEADDCDNRACIITSQSFDLSSYSQATLEFDRYVDSNLDRGEYLEVQIGDNGVYSRIFYWTDRSGDDRTWHSESYNLQNYLDSDSVTIRFLTEESSSSEDVGIDNVIVDGVTGASPRVYYGGNPHYLIYGGDHDHGIGTITIGAIDSSNRKVIVGSEHVMRGPYANMPFISHDVGIHMSSYDDDQPPDQRYRDTISTNRELRNVPIPVDADFVPVTESGVTISHKQVQMKNGTVIDVTYGRLSDVDRGERISIYGIKNNDQGIILFKNATIRDPYVRVLHNLGISQYQSDDGDSGAPIIRHVGNTAYLVGSHIGITCVFESESEGQDIVNVRHIRSLCAHDSDSDSRDYYRIFNAWENVEDEFNLR